MSETVNTQEPEIIYVTDENGIEHEYEVLLAFEVDGSDKKYLMVIPTDEPDDESDEVYAFRYEEDGDELLLYSIDDEEEWKLVEETFNAIISEESDQT